MLGVLEIFKMHIYECIPVQDSPSGCVLNGNPGVTQVVNGHGRHTAVATAYLLSLIHI